MRGLVLSQYLYKLAIARNSISSNKANELWQEIKHVNQQVIIQASKVIIMYFK